MESTNYSNWLMNRFKLTRLSPALLLLSSAVFACVCGNQAAMSLPSAPSATATATGVLDINGMEQKFFARQYAKDPMDKRLQRLELLLFGSTQEGDLLERLANLQEAVKKHSAAGAGAPGKNLKSQPVSKSQSEQIAGLEKKILKKTYLAEPVEKRLSRLETQVLGQSNASLATADRIQRLHKIVGIPDSIEQMPSEAMSPFNYGDRMGSDFMMPFGSGGTTDDINKQMNEMLKQMTRDLGQGGARTFRYHFSYPPNSQAPNGMRPLPQQQTPHHLRELPPNWRPAIPGESAPSATPDLPPYLDPNSI